MIDASFVKQIENLKEEALEPRFHIEHDITYSDTNWTRITPPEATPLGVSTLTAIVSYCEALIEPDMEYTIHIVDHETVTLVSNINETYRTREAYLEASTANRPFNFGQDTRITEFIVSLQAMFEQDENTATILAGVGNMSADSKIHNRDDGVSQTVEARVGIAQAPENVKLPNPVALRPFRTFPEIEQPVSNFVIRIKHEERYGFTVALHEADGGAWKIEAIASIKAWFEKQLEALIEQGIVTVLG